VLHRLLDADLLDQRGAGVLVLADQPDFRPGDFQFIAPAL
jgi:hypothetical protein